MATPDELEVPLPAGVLMRAVADVRWSVSFVDARADDWPLVYVNAAFERVSGFTSSEVVGHNCRVLQGPHRDQPGLTVLRGALAEQRPLTVRLLNRRPDGQDWWNELQLSFLRDEAGVVTHVMGLQHDVTTEVSAERDMWALAYQDPLTGLPNRRQLEQHLAKALARADRTGCVVALLTLDLNGFKAVNDTHGHPVGDALLRQLARRLQHAVRSTDLVARHGGDEFQVLLADLPREQARSAVVGVTRQIDDSLSAPFRVPGGGALRLTVSLGAALYPGEAAGQEELLHRADQDMYRSKLRTLAAQDPVGT